MPCTFRRGMPAGCSVELWKNGRKFRKLDYKSLLSDFAVKDRDLLSPTLLQKSLQEVMKQSVPEIIKALESKLNHKISFDEELQHK